MGKVGVVNVWVWSVFEKPWNGSLWYYEYCLRYQMYMKMIFLSFRFETNKKIYKSGEHLFWVLLNFACLLLFDYLLKELCWCFDYINMMLRNSKFSVFIFFLWWDLGGLLNIPFPKYDFDDISLIWNIHANYRFWDL